MNNGWAIQLTVNMRLFTAIVLLLLLSSSVQAQTDLIDSARSIQLTDRHDPLMPAFSAMPDSGILHTVSWLFMDNGQYRGRAPWYVPLIKITLSNAALWAVDRYVFNYDFSHISINSWKKNLRDGWSWNDSDRFGNDFFFHPYTGGGYFMDARSLGYNFWESIPYALFGAVEWKYFGENDQPTYPDLINTTVNGTLIGEIAYRLTSNIIDDSKTGAERTWRETAVALISPSRFFSRLLTGELWQVMDTTSPKVPMDVRLALGGHKVNDGTKFWSGPVKLDAKLDIEYGDPYVTRDRTPFDYFQLSSEFTNAYQRKYLGAVNAFGLLWGGASQTGKAQLLYGLFQHFNYFDNTTFELGDVAFGPGVVLRVPISNYHSIYSNWHASFMPFAANNAHYFPIDTTQTRDYSYGDGLQLRTETGFTLGNRLIDLALVGYYIYFNSYYGVPTSNRMLLLMPRIAINFGEHIGIGFEDQIFNSNRNSPTLGTASLARSEQRLYVQWQWDDFPKE